MKFKVVGALACVFSLSAFAGQIDIVNANGNIDNQFMSSNGGLMTTDFTGGFDNGVSVWLRARNAGNDSPNIIRQGSTYYLEEFNGYKNSHFSFEFQFSPEAGATIDNSNYFVQLLVDKDPSEGIDWSGAAIEGAVFGFWDGKENDSLSFDGVTLRNSGTVEFADTSGNYDELPEYTLSNSWKPLWPFLLGDNFDGEPGKGMYDIRLSAFTLNDDGSEGELLNTTQITAQVASPIRVPETGTVALMLTAGLAGFGLRRKRA